MVDESSHRGSTRRNEPLLAQSVGLPAATDICRAWVSRAVATSPSALLPGPPRACAMSLRRHSALAFVFWAVCCPLRLRAGAAVIQSTDQNIQYTGVWEVVKVNSTTTYAISNTTGAKAVYTFTGQSSNMLKTVRTLSEDLSRDENIRFRSRTSPRLQRWGYTDTVYRSRKRNRSCV